MTENLTDRIAPPADGLVVDVTSDLICPWCRHLRALRTCEARSRLPPPLENTRDQPLNRCRGKPSDQTRECNWE